MGKKRGHFQKGRSNAEGVSRHVFKMGSYKHRVESLENLGRILSKKVDNLRF